MTREDCWMTFSEALDSYLSNREGCNHFGPGQNRRDCEDAMRIAAEHMDALTGHPEVSRIAAAAPDLLEALQSLITDSGGSRAVARDDLRALKAIAAIERATQPP